jgi:muramoyltetrapeptide carboxypeptidase
VQFSFSNITKVKDELDSYKKLITGKIKNLEYDIFPLNHRAQNFTEAEAKMIGGNMTVIQTSLGTPWQIEAKDKIIFFEEVDERGYRIDRMFFHFEQAGIFNGVKAIVIGDISPVKEKNGTDLTEVAVSRFCARVNIPVFRINGIGHGKNNNPLPLNVKTIITKQKLKFIF